MTKSGGVAFSRLRSRFLGSPERLVCLVIAAGMSLRIAWALVRPQSGASGEAFRVAEAIATGRGFADAYQVGQGPTAHLLPISPGIAGFVYSLFGVNSHAAESFLTAWSIGLTFGAFILLFRAFGRLGMGKLARVGAVAFLSFTPTYIAQEAVDFRVWEGGLTSFLVALFLDRLTAAEFGPQPGSPGKLALLAGIGALLFFVNPSFGLAAVAVAVVFAVRHLTFKQTAVAGSMFAILLAAMVVPWALRNDRVLGEPIVLRSNLGLELALANHPAAYANPDRGQAFIDRLYEIHPALSGEAFARLKSMGGEVPYANALKVQAVQWISEHPEQTFLLSLRHLRQIYAPEPWQYTTFGTGAAAGLRSLCASLAGVLGLIALLIAVTTRRRAMIYPLLLVTVPALSLALFQPVPRYTYLFFPILTFAAADLIERIVERVRRRQTGAGKASHLPISHKFKAGPALPHAPHI